MYEHKDLYTIDFRHVKHYLEIHPIIKHALDFPDYYGCNLDALWDCLTDMVGEPIRIEILGLDVVELKYGDMAKKLIEVFREFKHYDDNNYAHEIEIEIVSGDKRVKIE